MTNLFMMALVTIFSVQGLTLDAFEISSTAFSMLTGIKSTGIPCDPFVLAALPCGGGQDDAGKWKRKARQAEQRLREEKYKLKRCEETYE